MTNHRILFYFLVSVLTACGSIPKSTTLVQAEADFQQAKNDPLVLKLASRELTQAEETLRAAEKAHQEREKEDMEALAYTADAQIKAARLIAEKKANEQRFRELSEERERMIVEALKTKLSKAEQELAELKAKQTARGLEVTLGNVLFATGKADLMPGAGRVLDTLASYLMNHPDKTVLIEGHTDSTGSLEFNQKLSRQRAEAVRDALIERGIAAERIKAVGYGPSRPIATNATPEGRQLNRRVEVIIQG